MSIADRLAALDTEYKQAPVGGDYEMPPPGIYQAVVDRFDTLEFDKGSSAGHLQLKTTFKIELDPQYAGKTVDTLHDLEDPERFNWLKKHLNTLGLDPESFQFSELMDKLHEVLDVPCEIAIVESKKTNPNTGEPYLNTYLNKRLGEPLKKRDTIKTGKSDVTPDADPGREDGRPDDWNEPDF